MSVDPEPISYSYVKKNLEKHGWTCKLESNNRRGFDITATKNGEIRKREVKSRTIGEYSPGGSLTQRTSDRRYFHFSDSQVDTADYFVCFFVSPIKKTAIVVPKEKFDLLKSRTKEGNRLSFSATRRFVIRDGKKIDISNYFEGWDLIE